uniref:Uncharacterized protein n=1 Tax=Arundo donax TaxID=35708 RepID=A0A0A9FYZ6_ARUDO
MTGNSTMGSFSFDCLSIRAYLGQGYMDQLASL